MIGIVTKKLTNQDVKELTRMVKAMSPEELAVVAEAMPVEFCMARIRSEIDRLHDMEMRIGQMVGLLEK